MGALTCIGDYLKAYGAELGRRVVEQFPALHQPSDPVWPAINELKRHPFPAQALAIMGIVKRWEEARCAAAVAECGTGKTLTSLGSVLPMPWEAVHCVDHVPPQLLKKGARVFLTLASVWSSHRWLAKRHLVEGLTE